MKKRHILISLLTLIVFVSCTVPGVMMRIENEGKHKACVPALNVTDTLKLFGNEDYSEVLRMYKDSGVTVGVVTEENNSFDEELLALIKDSGLKTAVFLDGTESKDSAYTEKAKKITKKYDISYIGVENPYHRIRESVPVTALMTPEMTLVVKERMTQLSNEQYDGYEEAIGASGGKILRCYETWPEPARTIDCGNETPDFADVLYHQMLNSAKDRNTEFVLINQIISGTDDPFLQAEQTCRAIEAFCAEMEEAGHDTALTPDLSGYVPNRRALCGGGAFIAVIMVLAMINIVFRKSWLWLDSIMTVAAFGAFGISFVLPVSLLTLYPTAYAVVAACFSFSVIAFFADRLKDKSSAPLFMCTMLALVLMVILACTSILASLLAGSDYYLNSLIFRGVKLTLLAPIAYSMVMSYLFYSDKGVRRCIADIPSDAKNLLKQIRLPHIIAAILVLAAGALYVMRSGNSGISLWENQIRNFISDISGARPRTKELLIGWPCVALWMYYVKNDHGKLWKWGFSVGASLLFASATNTFCHVFTDLGISVARTVNGLIFAIPIVLIVLGANAIVLKVITKKQAETAPNSRV